MRSKPVHASFIVLPDSCIFSSLSRISASNLPSISAVTRRRSTIKFAQVFLRNVRSPHYTRTSLLTFMYHRRFCLLHKIRRHRIRLSKVIPQRNSLRFTSLINKFQSSLRILVLPRSVTVYRTFVFSSCLQRSYPVVPSRVVSAFHSSKTPFIRTKLDHFNCAALTLSSDSSRSHLHSPGNLCCFV